MTFDTRTAIDRFFEVMDSANTITEPANPVTIGGSMPSGYCSDSTRTYAVGAEPPAAVRAIMLSICVRTWVDRRPLRGGRAS